MMKQRFFPPIRPGFANAVFSFSQRTAPVDRDQSLRIRNLRKAINAMSSSR